jgi:hypothetical protein
MSILSEGAMRRDSIQQYLLHSISDFEQGWKLHEQKLKQYELTQAKFKDWEQRPSTANQSTQSDTTVEWVNTKTGELSLKNPGFKYFSVNKKAMRKRAEEKFQKDLITRVEHERESLQIASESKM